MPKLSAAYRKLRRIQAELLRRLERRRRDTSEEVYPIVEAQALARELAHASPDHTAWDLLDRKRTERVLEADPRDMHPRSREMIWRLVAALEQQDSRLIAGARALNPPGEGYAGVPAPHR